MSNTILNDLATNGRTTIDTPGTTPSGLHFVYTISGKGDFDGNAITSLYSVGLPFVTSTHLLAVPATKAEHLKNIEAGSALERVTLEGSYDTYFSLYAGQGEQIESRVILDPEAMQFSIDFCSKYAWEIADNTLYFESDQQLPDLKIVDDFVREITPAIHTSSAMQLAPRLQTQEALSPEASKFLCPICKTSLHKGHRWYACPQGHGYLLTGSDLVITREHSDDLERGIESLLDAQPNVVTNVSVVEHGDLLCPNDNQPLEKTPYQQTSANLYVCHSCIFRWIDGQDLDTILGKYRNDGEDERSDREW